MRTLLEHTEQFMKGLTWKIGTMGCITRRSLQQEDYC